MDKGEFYRKKECHKEKANEDILSQIQRRIQLSVSRLGVYMPTVTAAERLTANICISE